MSGLSPTNRERLVKDGAAAFIEKTQNILHNDSLELLETVKSVLSGVRK